MNALTTVRAVTRKEFRQIVRDRRTLLIQVFVPAFFLLVFGYALNFDIRNIALAVEDRDGTPQSRELVAAFVNSGYFNLAATTHSTREAERLLDTNEARAVLSIPEGFGRTVTTGQRSPVQVIVNGDNANTARAVIAYTTSILQTAGVEFGARYAGGPAPERPQAIAVESRVWYNPELRSALFLIPGLIAYIAMLMSVTSTALSVVREKESGTIEQVRMAPVQTFPFIIGKTVPYFIIALASATIVFFSSMALFGLPMRGSWLTLGLALSIYLVGAVATGLLVSTIADTQQVAFQIALLVALLPTLMLSGFIFPISSMPPVLQAITQAVPARHFLVALRGIVLKGTDLSELLPQFAALGAYALLVLSLASVRLAREKA